MHMINPSPTWNMVTSIGFPPSYTGTRYLVEVLDLILSLDSNNVVMSREVYPVLAEKYGCGGKAIERNIRTCVHYLYRCKPEKLSRLMGRTLDCPPTTGDVIWSLIELIKAFK